MKLLNSHSLHVKHALGSGRSLVYCLLSSMM